VAPGDEVPLVLGLFQPAQQDVFALAGVDLPEHGFDDRFASGVDPDLLN
jgi:hypothetical protein